MEARLAKDPGAVRPTRDTFLGKSASGAKLSNAP